LGILRLNSDTDLAGSPRLLRRKQLSTTSITDEQSADVTFSVLPSVGEPPTRRISVTLSVDEYARVKSIAERNQRSLGWVLRYALGGLFEREERRQLELPFHGAYTSSPELVDGPLPDTINALATLDWTKLRRRATGTIHSLHAYPTRFGPEFPARLIESLSKPGHTVLDPFCGSGTVVAEAARRQRLGIGVDVSPLAVLISRTKCALILDEDLAVIEGSARLADSLLRGLGASEDRATTFDRVRECCEAAGICVPRFLLEPNAISQIAQWFSPIASSELALIRTAIEHCAVPRVKDLLLVALSSIIVRVSFQRSDTRFVRLVRDVAPGEALKCWTRKVSEIFELLRRTQHSGFSPRSARAEVHCADARDLNFLAPETVDLVVTSPPYPNSYDYQSFQRLRLLWLGLWSPRNIANLGGRRGAGKDYDRDILAVLTSIKRVLKSTGLCALVIGATRARGQHQDNAAIICCVAPSAGFRTIDRLEGPRASTMGTLHMNGREPVKGESLLLLAPR